MRHVAANLFFLPRGYRWTFASGATLATLGGGDGSHVEDSDLDRLRLAPADILVSHVPPLDVPGIPDPLPGEPASTRRHVTEAITVLMPKLAIAAGPVCSARTLGFIDIDGKPFTCQVVTLPPPSLDCAAASIDTRTMTLSVLDWSGRYVELPAEVLDLATQTSGRWLLRTLTSDHLVDLDKGTWERRPGDGATRFGHPGRGHIRTLEGAAVGERIRVTTDSADFLIEYEWAISTPVRSIERLEDE